MTSSLTAKTFRAISGQDADARGVAPGEPRNLLCHAGSLAMTKLADGLIDPKLVLSWMLGQLGTSAFLVGLLVPIREAGALLPQIFTAPRLPAMARRKWVWVAGSVGQAVAAAGIVAAGLTLTGAAAGIAVCVLLAVLAVSRSICSVSYKDILGRTVGRSRRGAATGFASSAASVGVILFALALMTGAVDRMVLVLAAMTLAAALWLAAAALFSTLNEEADPGETTDTPWSQFRLLREEPQLVRFIATRGLLTGSALAPPYLVLLGQEAGQGGFDRLGALVLASALASLLSSWGWGRLSDRSSRRVLQLCGLVTALALFGAVALHLAGLSSRLWALPLVLFVLMVAYHGVRQARSTYLVDMAPAELRAPYTAVTNTVIGVILLGSGIFGALASLAGVMVTLVVFAVMALAAVWIGQGLNEVEQGF
ncbi:MFS transporter [Oceaniovalibus sp. ACAM 378]|uniref:MFS transporter n=1 Tax=Oceaniovalibus sp. ACAM 378 TaxID=2599923 RepID=UPI0011DB30DE|nr:MFS transporter [Oceaniovalibus sp. ACAM 378]TYB91046.1 MFS transporter [Oceaniovalibus sp. ACAM 378]